MTKVEEVWAELIAARTPNAAQRVGPDHPSDLFLGVNVELQPGIILLTEVEPPATPGFDAVEVAVHHRNDGRWALSIWLRRPELRAEFAELCEDLIAASMAVRPAGAAAFLVGRLDRWRRLLERGDRLLSMSEIRGLIGELLVLQRCLEVWPVGDVVAGWIGPQESPQDFLLPGRRIEVKTVYPSARTVRITSLEQLDVADPMLLAVVTITAMPSDAGAVTLPEVVHRTRSLVEERGTDADVECFDVALRTASYRPDRSYDRIFFRVDDIVFHEVAGDFPMLRRAEIHEGIAGAAYDIYLPAIVSARTTLRA